MGDPNGNWHDIRWTAEFLHEAGISLLPLDGKGKPLADWREVLANDTSRLPLDDLIGLIDNGAEGLAIALGSSLNGDLWCRTFDRMEDYMKSVTLMGQISVESAISTALISVPLACAIREGEKTHVLFMMDKETADLEDFEEVASGRFKIDDPPGTMRTTHNLLVIPPGDGRKWIQEPVIDLANPNRTNLFYYDPVQVGLLPPF